MCFANIYSRNYVPFLPACSTISGPSRANGAFAGAHVELFISKTCKCPQQQQLLLLFVDPNTENELCELLSSQLPFFLIAFEHLLSLQLHAHSHLVSNSLQFLQILKCNSSYTTSSFASVPLKEMLQYHLAFGMQMTHTPGSTLQNNVNRSSALHYWFFSLHFFFPPLQTSIWSTPCLSPSQVFLFYWNSICVLRLMVSTLHCNYPGPS